MLDPVQKYWQPEGGPNLIHILWLMTTRCNYRCPYCMQWSKGKKRQHAFDRAPVEKWLESFERHFSMENNLSLLITGGEAMIDPENIIPFLETLSNKEWVKSIQLDSNLSPFSR